MRNQDDSSGRGDRPDELMLELRHARERFVGGFEERCNSIAVLINALGENAAATRADPLQKAAHQMAGLAGTVGFPTVGTRAAELERLVAAVPMKGADVAAMRRVLDAIRAAFADDDRAARPGWAGDASATAAVVLVVEDDAVHRAHLVAALQGAGYRTVEVVTGEETLDRAREVRPALILLDVNLPGMDGYAVCRRLKAAGDLASIPLMFLTSRTGVDDRLTGLALGADDYIQRPVDARELTLRVERLVRRTVGARSPDDPPAAILSYEAFVQAAETACASTSGTLALVRLPKSGGARVAQQLIADARRRDLIGSYDRGHVVMFMPELPASAAFLRLTQTLEVLSAQGIASVHAGVSSTIEAGQRTLEMLLADADEALTDARYEGQAVSRRTDRSRRDQHVTERGASVVIAEDDPDVMRIIDAQMRRAGFTTTLAFDGAAAVEAVQSTHPDLLLLDLMMPKLTGFDVLARLQGMEKRPRIIVVSNRGREDDVTRAFELGADDYVAKPFSPPELMARVQRLLR